MITIMGLLLSILTGIIILLLVDNWNAKKIKKVVREDENISTDKYFELKWRINFLLSIVGVASVLIGFLGYNLNDQLRSQILDLQTKTNRLDSLINLNEGKYQKLDSIKTELERELNQFEKTVVSVKEDINNVKNENLRQSQVYIVTNIPINIDTTFDKQRIYYADLVTTTDRKLPRFFNPPIVNIIDNEKEAWINIISVTDTYFEISEKLGYWALGGANHQEKKIKDKFDVWISNQ